jgi:hypothetical protein
MAALSEQSVTTSQALATQLGWTGVALLGVRVLGFSLDLICDIDESAHRERTVRGLAPVVDPWLFSCLHDDDESFRRLPVIRLQGAFARRSRWESARSAVSGVRSLCPGVAVLPKRALRQTTLWEADVSGVGLAVDSATGVELQVPHAGWTPPPYTPMTRLLTETVYDTVIRRGLLPVSA